MLSKIFKSLSLLLFTFYFLITPLSATQAQSSDTGWVITDFKADISIASSTTVDVTETITVDFNTLSKHGIYRLIPVKYTTKYGNSLNIHPRSITVTNQKGQSIPFTTSTVGNDLQLKIGDADKTISGVNTYLIHYQVNQVITSPGDTAEFYWNVTGTGWPVPILKTEANITAPTITDTICFTGYYNQTDTNCTHGHNSTTAVFTATTLDTGQGLTIATALDPTSLTFPTKLQQTIWLLQANWPYFLPFLTLAAMFYLYWTRGRDRQFRSLFHQESGAETVPLLERVNAMTVYAPPKDLSPGEVGTLIDERVNSSDVTATIVDLARRGFFIVKEIPKKGIFGKLDFELLFQNQLETGLKDYEKSVLDMLFGISRIDSVKLSKLPTTAYEHLQKAQTRLYQELTDTGYFAGNPQTIRRIYLVAGIVVAIAGIALIGPWLSTITSPASAFIGVITSGLIIAAFSFFMPARTPKGRKSLQEVVGLKEWIKLGAWREQIHEKHNFFEEVLPFAIAFGLTQKFIQAFEKTKLKSPDWYQGSGTFNALYFSNSINHLSSSVNSGVAATKPSSASSGGSGFSGGGSGGGFGGGGGGSW